MKKNDSLQKKSSSYLPVRVVKNYRELWLVVDQRKAWEKEGVTARDQNYELLSPPGMLCRVPFLAIWSKKLSKVRSESTLALVGWLKRIVRISCLFITTLIGLYPSCTNAASIFFSTSTCFSRIPNNTQLSRQVFRPMKYNPNRR